METLFGDRRELTPALRQRWEDVCEHFYDEEHLPDKESTILVKESVVKFPGLKLENTVFNGMKLLDENGCFPVYQGVLLEEKIQVSGSAPAVWCFKQLTGTNKRDDTERSSSESKATSRISIVAKDGGYALHIDCQLSVFLDFPKVLCRILPTTKEGMEKIGSASVQKAVVKEIMKAMNSTSDSFKNWRKAETVQAV